MYLRSYNQSVDVKYFKTFRDLSFIESQVIKTSKTFFVGNKFYTPVSIHWTFDLQEITLFLQDNNSTESVVYFHQIPDFDLFELLKFIQPEEIFNINKVNFRPLTYFN